MLDVELVEPKGSIFLHSDHGFDAGRAQKLDPGATDSLVGIRHRDHDPAHAGLEYGLGAERRPMCVSARLQSHVQRATPRARTRNLERLLLRVRSARLAVITL